MIDAYRIDLMLGVMYRIFGAEYRGVWHIGLNYGHRRADDRRSGRGPEESYTPRCSKLEIY